MIIILLLLKVILLEDSRSQLLTLIKQLHSRMSLRKTAFLAYPLRDKIFLKVESLITETKILLYLSDFKII